MTRRLMRLAVVLLAGVGLIVAPGVPQAGAASTDGWVRAAHFSPDTAGVDVYLTAFSGGTTTLWLSDVGYGDVSPYRRIAAGDYAVSMRPHGASMATPAALSWNVNIAAGDSYTAAAVGMTAALKGVVFQDQLTGGTSAEARVVQASSRAVNATVKTANGTVIGSGVAFGTTTAYAALPSGTQTILATSDSDPSVTATTSLTVAGATLTTLVLLDAKGGGVTLRAIADSAGAVTAPSGSVPAGGGGTAARPTQSFTADLIAIGGGIVLLLGLALGLRRRRVRTSV